MLSRSIKAPELENELKLVNDWVGGKPISEIRSTYWTNKQEDEFGLYVAERLTYKMPWGLNGFLRILAFKLHKEFDELPLAWQFLPSMMKFGVNSVFACWIGSFGVSSRQLAFELAQHYPNPNDNSFTNFLKWLINLPYEFLYKELPVGSVVEKKRLINKMNKMVVGNTQLQSILQRQTVFETSVQGIPYENRASIASLVRLGDQLELQAELDNPLDPSAVSVLFEGKQIGYVRRDTAKILSTEMQSGKEFGSILKSV
jgi:helicase